MQEAFREILMARGTQSPNVRCIVGDYGTGKTSILDSLDEFHKSLDIAVVTRHTIDASHKPTATSTAHEIVSGIISSVKQLPTGLKFEVEHSTPNVANVVNAVMELQSRGRLDDHAESAVNSFISGTRVAAFRSLSSSAATRSSGHFTRSNVRQLIPCFAQAILMAGGRLSLFVDEIETLFSRSGSIAQAEHLDLLRFLVDSSNTTPFDLYVSTTNAGFVSIANYRALADRISPSTVGGVRSTRWDTRLFHPSASALAEKVCDLHTRAYGERSPAEDSVITNAEAIWNSLDQTPRIFIKFIIETLDKGDPLEATLFSPKAIGDLSRPPPPIDHGSDIPLNEMASDGHFSAAYGDDDEFKVEFHPYDWSRVESQPPTSSYFADALLVDELAFLSPPIEPADDLTTTNANLLNDDEVNLQKQEINREDDQFEFEDYLNVIGTNLWTKVTEAGSSMTSAIASISSASFLNTTVRAILACHQAGYLVRVSFDERESGKPLIFENGEWLDISLAADVAVDAEISTGIAYEPKDLMEEKALFLLDELVGIAISRKDLDMRGMDLRLADRLTKRGINMRQSATLGGITYWKKSLLLGWRRQCVSNDL